jgi:hypothetical protein
MKKQESRTPNEDKHFTPSKKVIYSIIQTVMIVLIACIAGEVALRVYNYFNPVYIFYTDSYSRFRGKPFEVYGDFKLNSRGFNDVEFASKQENSYRILGIGDSFAFGVVPRKYNYLKLLESQLNKKGVNVEVLNMGIPNTGPKDYLSILVREGLELKPDMVLVSFFLGNDFADALGKRKWYSYSYLASLIHYFMTIRPQVNNGIMNKKEEYCDSCPTFQKDTYLEIEYGRSVMCVKGGIDLEKIGTEGALSYLIQMRNICKRKGIALTVVIIPDEAQVNLPLQTEIKNKFFAYLPNDQWDVTLPNTILVNKLKSLGIDYLDLYESFAKASKQKVLYKPRDTHWNLAGNQLAADVIQDYLIKTKQTGKFSFK